MRIIPMRDVQDLITVVHRFTVFICRMQLIEDVVLVNVAINL
jgi:hypothetical protein